MATSTKNERILVCDVDGVVVDLSYHWYHYLKAMVKDIDIPWAEVSMHYNFHKPFEKFITQEEAFYFWKQENLYDGATPVGGAVEALSILREELGYKIVFASHVEGNHAKSKYEFLKRNFNFDGFVATREKGFIRADIAIDDRIEHLASHPDNVYTVLKNTRHAQTFDGSFTPNHVLQYWSRDTVNDIVHKAIIHHDNRK